jgi:hypothetical protein
MNTFLIKLACFLAVQMAILTPLAYVGDHYRTSRHYLCSIQDKLELLKSAASPRIIFIGGSNLAFGLNSQLIAEQTGYHPVNMGVHAEFGINPLMRMAEAHAKPGDLIVLAPEYGVFRKDGLKCSQEFAVKLYDLWPGCREYFQPDVEAPLPKLAKPPLFLLADRVVNARRYLFDSQDQRVPGIYERGSFNEFGDHVKHYGVDRNSVHHEMGAVRLDLDKSHIIENIETINQFCERCQQRGASVVFTHAPLSATNGAAQPETKQRFEATLVSGLTCPVITSVDQLTFEDDLFFDTEYHLTEAGATKRTAVLCRQILRYQDRLSEVKSQNKNFRLLR